MSNPTNLPGASDLPGSPSPVRGAGADLGIALAAGAGLAATCTLAWALGGSWTTGAALGAGLLVPGVMFSYAALRRRHRDRYESIDERARFIGLTSRGAGFLAIVGMLAGVAGYRWFHDGYASAEPYLYLLAAGGFVQAVAQFTLRRRS